MGSCVPRDCEERGCPNHWRCLDGECRLDPCLQIECPADEEGRQTVCKRGTCLPSCANVVCPVGQVCSDGACLSDPCLSVSCPENEHCFIGQCYGPCEVCAEDTICLGDSCVEDPCTFMECPTSERCEVNAYGHGQCVADGQGSEESSGVRRVRDQRGSKDRLRV